MRQVELTEGKEGLGERRGTIIETIVDVDGPERLLLRFDHFRTQRNIKGLKPYHRGRPLGPIFVQMLDLRFLGL